MSILNRATDGLLSVVLALRRALIAYGPQEKDRLLELCAPKSEPLGGPAMARKALTRWRQLGLFEEKEGIIKIAPVAKKIDANDLPAVRAVMLRLVLAPENNPLVTADAEGDDDTKSELSKAADFSRAASWALAQDPYSFARSYPQAEKIASEQKVLPRPFSNDTRWAGFVEWAGFLGLAVQVSKVRLVLNPHFAVASVFDEVFEKATELSQDTFLARLSEALPIVDGGRYRQLVDATITCPWHAVQPYQVSPCLSAALQTLVERKMIRLEPRSDATQRVLLGREGREGHTFSHVIRLKAAA